MMHAFIDESGRAGQNKFMMCAATVQDSDIGELRSQMRALRTKGTSRIHMKSEGRNAGRIISAVAALEVQSYLFVVKKRCSTRSARDLVLTHMFDKLRELGVTRAVIESCSQDTADRRTIHDILGPSPSLQYVHEPAGANNPMLWIPDVHAWAWGRGGLYRRCIEHRIDVQLLA